VQFERKKIFSSTLKNVLAYYNAGLVCSCKLKKPAGLGAGNPALPLVNIELIFTCGRHADAVAGLAYKVAIVVAYVQEPQFYLKMLRTLY
jgi:hypothetical protein